MFFCRASIAMKNCQNERLPLLAIHGKIWDTHWIPIKGTDNFLHYAYDVTNLISEKK
jgi:hypothetical protein